MVDRRRLLQTGLGGLAALALPRPLAAAAASGADVHTLRAAPASLTLYDKGTQPAALWLYNGTSPGPTLRARQGDTLRVRLVNQLEQPTSVHWHGIRIDNEMDGVVGLTQDAVAPGDSFDYAFTVPDAGTYWYHTHNRSWEQLARGLYGLLIVDEPDPYPVDREQALVFDDWRLAEDGSFDAASLGNLHDWAHAGRFGNWLTVNGRSAPELAVRSGERLRLRLANTANARIMEFEFAGHDVWLIALDGHPVTPRELADGRITLAPAQRADLVLDATLKPGSRAPIREVSTSEPYDAAQLVYGGETAKGSAGSGTPPGLPLSMPHDAFRPDEAQTVELVMSGGAMGRMSEAMHKGRMMGWRELVENRKVWAMNGVAGDLDQPLASVRRGRTVAMRIVNDSAFAHAMHLHGHHFRVIARNGTAVSDAPWRDTDVVGAQEEMTIAFLADNPGKWLFHCHMIEHQAGGMVTWIEVAG